MDNFIGSTKIKKNEAVKIVLRKVSKTVILQILTVQQISNFYICYYLIVVLATSQDQSIFSNSDVGAKKKNKQSKKYYCL